MRPPRVASVGPRPRAGEGEATADEEADASEEYDVLKIHDHRFEDGQLQYLVEWKGWDGEQTWEPVKPLKPKTEIEALLGISPLNTNRDKQTNSTSAGASAGHVWILELKAFASI